MLTPARPEEAAVLLAHYQSMVGLPSCTWSADYPNAEDVAHDIATGSVYTLRDAQGEIIAAASTEEDEVRPQPFCVDKTSRSIEISRVMVVRAHQGKGLARTLVSELLDHLRSQGFEVVRLLVSRNNLPAYRTYIGLGFQPIGECDLYDVHWTACELRIV